ncbi:MAG TPA: glycosyltransferase [Bacteroidaceae bacterium]|nr:glycosyltransferase [Bacteroidaceae bacterium]
MIYPPSSISPFGIILLVLTGCFLLIQLAYLLILYNPLFKKREKSKQKFLDTNQLQPLSVIIVSNNQRNALERNLESILNQDYPNFEIIVVDDNSNDDTNDFLTNLGKKYKNLRHTFTSDSIRHISPKKLALTIGIKASVNDWVVFTNPECSPASDQWLKKIGRNFTDETDIVMGYYNYKKGGRFFDKVIIFDQLLLSMRYLGAARIKRPYMAQGENMAYRKKLFFDKKGYSKHLNLVAGDDDLFINGIVTHTNSRVEISLESMIWHDPIDFYSWKIDKLFYASTSYFFKGYGCAIAGLESTSRYGFYGAAIGGIVVQAMSGDLFFPAILAFTLLLRGSCQFFVFRRGCRKYGHKTFYFSLLLFNITQPIWNTYFKITSKISTHFTRVFKV